jgi:hypothetical protein
MFEIWLPIQPGMPGLERVLRFLKEIGAISPKIGANR